MENPFSALESLCDVAAAVSEGAPKGDDLSVGVKEVEAFNSVHDMIHAAIVLRGGSATLQQIYTACQVKGRITHKRTGGSRLITENGNWKCQIRHALYTANRFKRQTKDRDYWVIGEPYAQLGYSTTKVMVAWNEVAGDMADMETIENEEAHCTKMEQATVETTSMGYPLQLHAVTPGSYISLNNIWGPAAHSCNDAKGYSKCPVLGVTIPRKPRSIQRAYILHGQEGFMMSDAESEGLQQDVIDENIYEALRNQPFSYPGGMWHKQLGGKDLESSCHFQGQSILHTP